MEKDTDTTRLDNNSPGSEKAFTPPRHWIAPEELSADYWNDPKAMEKRGQEFHDKPIETLEMIERMDQLGIARRDFLTIMGASMAMAGVACARRPVTKIIPYVVKPEEVTPGIATWYASTDPETGYGLLVKTREARPIKLEGNPDHPLNRGKLGAQQQASLLSLYDPERLKEPLARVRDSGEAQVVSWDQIDSAIREKLRSAAAAGGKVRLLTKPVLGYSRRNLIEEFVGAFGAGSHVEFDPLAEEDLAQSQRLCYGEALIPKYRFDQAEVIVSLGADYLGTWNSPVEHMRDWIQKRRPGESGDMSKCITFEPTLTITGAKSDERYPIRPGDQLKVALAIANEIIINGGKSRFAGRAQLQRILADYTPKVVAEEIGLEGGEAAIKNVANLLWKQRGRGLIVGSGAGVALQVAINLLNSACENEGQTIDGTANPNLYAPGGYAEAAKLVADMHAGRVDVLIIHRANPVYSMPSSLGFAEALTKVPTVIVIDEHDTETARHADFVLPDHHYLENWGDARPRKNVYSVQQPVIRPLFNSRAFEDSLITWAKGAGLRVSALATTGTWHDYVRGTWLNKIYNRASGGKSFTIFWEDVLSKGVLDTLPLGGRGSERSFRLETVEQLPRYKAAATGKDIVLTLYPTVAMRDGSLANNAWLQELPDPISTITWDNFLNVSPALAKKLQLKTNDVAEISSGDLKFKIPVQVQPGLHPHVVSAAVGYGRTRSGKVGTGVGVNLYPFVRVQGGEVTMSGHPVQVRKTGIAYRLAQTQWHHVTEGRPIINDVTLAEYRQNPRAENHLDPHLRMKSVPTMWAKHEYPNRRWGMAIDLNACTGCSACVVACQAENNVPVVGRNNVRVSREMHWLRIDRYYSGSAENPNVVFQPMLCQHCENAPCETVCPVLATVHSSDGLSEQVYNRCVGTRYCQNNCPYKVRRFNFFDHWKSYDQTMNLVWNPDVTVRSRGIMEKCSFCVQRIRETERGLKKGEKLKDGTLKTACQQTCPTDAIVFGDTNDRETQVSKLWEEPRSYKVLQILNTQPQISYLSLVRNTEKKADHGETRGDHH